MVLGCPPSQTMQGLTAELSAVHVGIWTALWSERLDPVIPSLGI